LLLVAGKEEISKDQLPIYQLPIYQLPETSYQKPATRNQLPETSYQKPATSYQLPATSYQIFHTSGCGVGVSIMMEHTLFGQMNCLQPDGGVAQHKC